MIGPRRAQYAPKSIKFRSIPRGGQCLAKPCLHYCCRFSPIAHRFHRLRVRASREQVDQVALGGKRYSNSASRRIYLFMYNAHLYAGRSLKDRMI